MRRLPVYIILVCLGAFVLSYARSDNWDSESLSRKADYIFLEAQNAFNHEDYSAYITLLQRAYDLDSADIDIAGEWALTAFSLSHPGDEEGNTEAARAYELLRRRFLANPTYINGKGLASVATHARRFDDVLMVWKMLDSLLPARQDVSVSLANAYVAKSILGDTTALDSALAIFRRLEGGVGKNAGLSSQIIRALLLRHDSTSVVRELQSLMRANPADSYTALYVGSTFEYLDKPDSTLKYLDLACNLDSANGSAYMARASFYMRRGDSIAFDREVFNALNSRDLEVETKVEMLRSYVSELYTDSTQHPRINALFDHLVQLHPGEPEIHNLYGAYLYELGKADLGAEQLMYAVALEPDNHAYRSQYVIMLSVAGLTERASIEAAEASRRFPDDLYFPIARASIFHNDGKIDCALAILDSVKIDEVRNVPAVSNFIGYKADLLAAKGDTLSALEEYDKAITLNPDNIGAMNNAAYFMSLLPGADLEKALRYSSRAIKAEPAHATYLDTYAWILFKSGDIDLALNYIDATVRIYEEEMEDNPQMVPSADIYDHAGDIYFRHGDKEKAMEFWQKALEIEPDNSSIRSKIKNE